MNAIVTRDNVKRLFSSVEGLTKKSVLVGVPAAETDRFGINRIGGIVNDEGADYMTNASILFIQEHGSPKRNIPARPVLNPAVKSSEDKTLDRMKKAARQTIDGDPNAVTRELNSIGLIIQNAAKNRIRHGLEPELSPATLAARRRRGRTGEKPLYDTGQLINSITYVIRENKRA